ncbi:TetR/AcrR family transcriptional regulator [Pseudonocardia nigra]|uniref:TetR/AcrR family transcriptional regulator n=1 Tax=Pseudonocardia nigra TaxID=1921578 RepID=UPI001C60500B|nr:TetR/AcrR family transcriptional regulator [Pseudonocardia nigra]
MTEAESLPTPAVDGRTARRQRTRAAIVDALLDLVREGELKPTGAKIAARAQISQRALWANFADLETLYQATGRVLLDRHDELAMDIPVDLPRAERIARFCAQRAELHELISPFARANRLREPFSAALRRNRRRYLDRIAADIERVFDEELRLAGPGRADRVAALVACASWSWWSILREDLAIDVERAVQLMELTVAGVLETAAQVPISGPPGATPS